jgi:hypothetical protein
MRVLYQKEEGEPIAASSRFSGDTVHYKNFTTSSQEDRERVTSDARLCWSKERITGAV